VQPFTAGIRLGAAEKDLSGKPNIRKTAARKNIPDRGWNERGMKAGEIPNFRFLVIQAASWLEFAGSFEKGSGY
jgi:hypothetical protein